MILRLTAKLHQTDIVQEGARQADMVGICLEHDVVMQGRDQDDVITALSAGIALMVIHARESGVGAMEVLGGPPPAEEVACFTGPLVSFEIDTDDPKWEIVPA